MSTPGERRAWLLLAPAALWWAVFFALPLGVILAVSLLARGEPVRLEFSLDAWARLADPLVLRILGRTFLFAAAATVLCLLLGYPLALYLARRTPRLRAVLYFLVLVPLSANTLILLFAWMTLLRHDGLLHQAVLALGLVAADAPWSVLYTPGAIILGLVYWYLPFMVYPIHGSLERLDWRLVEAAADLGAGRWAQFRRVILPLTLPGVATGCLLVFLQALCTFVIPDLLGGGKHVLVGTFVQQRFLHLPQDWPLGAAVAVVLLAALGAGLYGVLRAQRSAP